MDSLTASARFGFFKYFWYNVELYMPFIRCIDDGWPQFGRQFVQCRVKLRYKTPIKAEAVG